MFACSANGKIDTFLDGKLNDTNFCPPLIHLEFSNSGFEVLGITDKGGLISFKYPFEPNGDKIDYFEYLNHSKSITSCCFSFDDQYFFTSGDDGSIWIYKINDESKNRKEKDCTHSDEV